MRSTRDRTKETQMNSQRNDVPVVIVGAGPTGVMLAIELARRGVEVRVLDKQPSRPQETRAIGIHARTLEVFDQLGLIDEFLELGHRLDGVVVHSKARRDTRVPFGGLDSPYPQMLTLSQEVTQRILDERLERLGVTIERGVEVTDLRDAGDGVRVTLNRAGDRSESFTADWAIGCDGAHSIVRRRLGIPFEGEDYGQDWLMAEVALEWPVERDHFHIFTYTVAPLVTFPLPSDRWRVFLPQVPGRSREGRAPDMEEIKRLAALRGPTGMKLTDPTLLATFRCYRRSTGSMRQGRFLLAGDAAHIHSPAGGQGLNTGLQDAFNLGWKLALVARGEASPALLDTYSAERVPIAAGVLKFTHLLVRTFTVASPRVRWARDRILPAVMTMPSAQARYARRMSQLYHSYRGGPLARIDPGDPRRPFDPGDRVPCVTGLRRGDKPVSTLDLLASRSHTVLVLAGERADMHLVDAAIARLARHADLLKAAIVTGPSGSSDPDAVIDADLRAHRRYGAMDGRLLLVRPDGYLAADAPLDQPEILERYLLRLRGGGARRTDESTHADWDSAGLRTQPAGAPVA
jgi:2-polyprenyl-6-methoxyphenol hydroxylase-like FAD-dependent oxidoreductase